MSGCQGGSDVWRLTQEQEDLQTRTHTQKQPISAELWEKKKKLVQYGNLRATDLIIVPIFSSRFTSCISPSSSAMIYRTKEHKNSALICLFSRRRGEKRL